MNYHRNTRDSRVKNIEVSSHARACIRACWHASPCNAENPCCSQELRLEPVEEEVLESTTKSVNDLQSSIIIHCFYSPSLRPISLPPFRLLPFFSPQWESPRETPHSKSVVKETAGLKRVKFTSLFRLSHIFAGGAALVVIYPVIQIHSECPGNSFILAKTEGCVWGCECPCVWTCTSVCVTVSRAPRPPVEVYSKHSSVRGATVSVPHYVCVCVWECACERYTRERSSVKCVLECLLQQPRTDGCL